MSIVSTAARLRCVLDSNERIDSTQDPLRADIRPAGGIPATALAQYLTTHSNSDFADGEFAGLPRSFLSAGAEALIASLWPAADQATSILMAATYQQLSQGVDLQKAMQVGQLTVLRQRRFSHPFFWAPFNVIGNWRLTFGR